MPFQADLSGQALQWIWIASVVIALVALSIVMALAVQHACGRRAYLDRARARERVEQLMRGTLYSPVAALPPQIDPSLLPLAFEVALDWLRFIRGAEAQRILAMLDVWRVHSHVRNRLMTGTPAEKIRALTYYGYCKDAETLDTLLRTATTESGDLQLAALRALAARSAAEHLPAILPVIRREGRLTSLLIADVLRGFGEAGVPHLIGAAQSAPDAEIRCAAIAAIAAVGAREAGAAIALLCKDPDDRVRASALHALRRLGSVDANDSVARALGDAHGEVRAAAAAAAGALGMRHLAGGLTGLLHDTDWSVRHNAAEALRTLGQPGLEILRRTRGEQSLAGSVAHQVLAEAFE